MSKTNSSVARFKDPQGRLVLVFPTGRESSAEAIARVAKRAGVDPKTVTTTGTTRAEQLAARIATRTGPTKAGAAITTVVNVVKVSGRKPLIKKGKDKNKK